MPNLNRVIETALYVDDIGRARAFYETVLGLTPMLSRSMLQAYDIGGASVLLLFRRGDAALGQHSEQGDIPPHDGRGQLHICFAIDADQLTDWEDRLRHHGIAIEGRMAWPRGGKSLYFRDPDGHLLELMTPGTWPNY